MFTDLTDKVIIITGASSGFGKVLALRLSMEHARLVLLSRSADKLQDVASQIKESNGSASCFSCNITDRDQIGHALEYVTEAYGRVDVLINSAAIRQEGAIDDVSQESVYEMFNVNSIGLILMTQAVLPILKQTGAGQIVNIVSTAAFEPMANLSLYSATKAAVHGFTESLEKELEGTGIHVSGIYPGGVDTDLFGTMPLTDQKTQILEDANKLAEIVTFILKQPKDVVVDHLEFRKLPER